MQNLSIKKTLLRAMAILLTAAMLLGLSLSVQAKEDPKVLNIGMTNPLLSMNPLITDATEAMKYTTGFAFLPLLELNNDAEFVPQIVSSVDISKDMKEYTLHIDKDAKWSDGEEITAEDVAYTFTVMTSDAITNPLISNFHVIMGLDENGTHKDSEMEIEGLVVKDKKTLIIRCSEPINPVDMQNGILRYVQPVPKHILSEKSTEELKGDPWFEAPTAVSGPYIPVDVDKQHYVSFVANEKYWKGAPKISRMNVRIYSDGSNLLPAIKAGEVQLVQPSTGSFPQEDIESLENMDGVHLVYGTPITNQLLFFNTERIDDVRVRQAIMKAIDREMLVENFLDGKGEVFDGLVNHSSRFTHSKTEPAVGYDPEGAMKLLEEAGWDKSRELTMKINSGDRAMALAADVIAAQLDMVGIRLKVQKQDFNKLLADAGSHDYDLFVVQYTLAPAAPGIDVVFLLGNGDGSSNWSQYKNEKVNEYLEKANLAADTEEAAEAYGQIDLLMQEDAPIINLYVIASPGICVDELKHADPTAFGAFLNIHEWSFE